MEKYYGGFGRSYKGDNPSKFRGLINKLSFHCANMSDGKNTVSLSGHTPDGDVTVLRTPFVEYVKVTLIGGGNTMFLLNDYGYGDYNILYTLGTKPAEVGKKGIITKIYDIGVPDEGETSKIYPPYVYSVNTHDPFEKITVRSLKKDEVLASMSIHGEFPEEAVVKDFIPTSDGVVVISEKRNVLLSWHREKIEDVWGAWAQYLPEDLVPGYVGSVDTYFTFFKFDKKLKQFFKEGIVQLPVDDLVLPSPQNTGYSMNGLFDFTAYGKSRFLIALEGRGDFTIYTYPGGLDQLWPGHVGFVSEEYPGIAYMYDMKTLELIPSLSRNECTDDGTIITNKGILREIVNDEGQPVDELWNVVGDSGAQPPFNSHMDIVKYDLSTGAKTVVYTVAGDWSEYSAMQNTYDYPRFIMDSGGILIAHQTSLTLDGFHRVGFNGIRDATKDIISIQYDDGTKPRPAVLPSLPFGFFGGGFNFVKNFQVNNSFYPRG